MASFATPADMIVRFDSRTLGDLVSDDGNRADEDELADNEKLTALLSASTGDIKAAVLRGERYTAAELEAMTGDAAEHLKDLCCRICWGKLWARKPYNEKNETQRLAREEQKEALEQLRTGDHVFDITRALEAGRPDISTVSREEVVNDYSLFVDQARGRFYPRRRSYKQT